MIAIVKEETHSCSCKLENRKNHSLRPQSVVINFRPGWNLASERIYMNFHINLLMNIFIWLLWYVISVRFILLFPTRGKYQILNFLIAWNENSTCMAPDISLKWNHRSSNLENEMYLIRSLPNQALRSSTSLLFCIFKKLYETVCNWLESKLSIITFRAIIFNNEHSPISILINPFI